jgi:cation diffusion facilitator CzcD-associated flavoprotein CzcO
MIIAEATQHDEQVALAEELMDKKEFKAAAFEASKVLEEVEPSLETIAHAALLKGRALTTHVLTEMSEKGELPPTETFDAIWKVYELSRKLNPDCETTKEEMTKVSHLLRELPPPRPPKQVAKADFDVLVVGAGAAGIGCALMLTKTFGVDMSRVVLMEQGEHVGQTFRNWPKEMRFISPSFNQQGWTDSFDLNAIANNTSPAYTLHTEHPSGSEYADYLSAIAKTTKLNVQTSTKVVSIKKVSDSKDLPLFSVKIAKKPSNKTETLLVRYVVWAAGEFQYPRASAAKKEQHEEMKSVQEDKHDDNNKNDKGEKATTRDFPGSELCMHNSEVRSWAELPGDDFVIIGGYESGVDAAVNLSKAGKKCKVLASTPCWSVKTADPSFELAPYTAARLRTVLAKGFSPQPSLFAPLRVVRVVKAETGGFRVTAKWKVREEASHAPLRNLVNEAPTEPMGQENTNIVMHTQHPPVLCTGFEGSVAASASHLFEFADSSKSKKGCLDGAPLLTKNDESTKIPGVFLVGPTVSHGTLSFCFVYKFRQRFAVVANSICGGLGIDTRAAVADCRKANMYLDDFSCCSGTCSDVC